MRTWRAAREAITDQSSSTPAKLDCGNIQYDVVPCDVRAYPEACRISGDCLAKAIVLRRGTGYMLAVLPASHHLLIFASRI
jgi:prolyl-tRNA editing enzyme YbaK/EbsC (Cys-tRNA(Pro) deacylase)